MAMAWDTWVIVSRRSARIAVVVRSRVPRESIDNIFNCASRIVPSSPYALPKFLHPGTAPRSQEKRHPKGANGPLRFSGLGPSPNHGTSLYCVSGARIHARSPDGLPAMLEAAPYGDPT